ncbi:tRNA A-37 threonylcarbamoyl transferase component Bud32 [Bacillus tianshenii]|uniref:tRNA A-37 threonylcarbamoyl transferase component Bud32 n=1 Tax=Sutcliffiella tianshenii TaxID=1463404 RepID=A0ABS2NZB5_9BACI|nr:aminoglycoside phosphotransferase family protein [Bacillus tianshenii]MBM7619959.1 tRNA A-37 threonylcarbamoyl transferase component Bud32 [Bacillus tianshenii]
MTLLNKIATGNTASIYLHENKVVKVFRDDLPASAPMYEASKQQQAYGTGLRVPEVFEVTIIDGKPALVMEYVSGKTLGQLVMEDREQAGYYMGLSVDIQREIHEKKIDSMEPMKEKLERQIESVGCLNQEVKAALLGKLASMTFESRLCHGDFHLYNLIQTDDGITIIDWVDASSGDIRADVYRSYLLYSQVSTELAELYVEIYCEKSGLGKEEIFSWAPIVAAARLAENVATEDEGRLLAIAQSALLDD